MISVKVLVLASSSRGNVYHVTDGVTPLLLDCGLRLKEIREGIGFKLRDLGGCLVTHGHADHSMAAGDLLKAGVDVYTSQGTAEMTGISGHRLHTVQALKQFEIGSWRILPFTTEHDAPEPYGYLLQSGADKLLYATDTCYIRYRFNGLTHIMIECNYDEELLREKVRSGNLHPAAGRRIRKNHFGLKNVKDFMRANDLSKVKVIYLLHLSSGNSDAERFKREVQELTGKPVIIAEESGLNAL